MATEARKFQVGLFVLTAVTIGVAAVIWLGASRFFERTDEFVSYFAESIQGLDPGAAVKFRGVPAGRVAAVRIAPDGELIEVRMDVDDAAAEVIRRDPSLRAALELSGITGLRYIEIDRRTGQALDQSPALTFEPPAELIPSARSSFKAVQSALGDVYDQFMAMDLPDLANQARNTLQAADSLLRDQRIGTVLTNVESVSRSASDLTRNLETMTRNVALAPAVANATEATAAARDLFANLTSGPTAHQLNDALEQINRLAQSAQQVVLGMQYTIERLDRTVDNLQTLTDEVRSQPSLLLFSAPPASGRTRRGADR
ncbi:MlaD family protein [Candidatus Binatia bacterium]|nr:MlaD family protein [Candidatus Binatia bacterium]